MTPYTLIRNLYRRARSLPLIGPLVEALRYRRWPVVSTAGRRYAEQQSLLEAHGHAIAGLRQGLAAAQQGLVRLEAELYDQVHRLNLARDQLRQDTEQRIEFIRQEMLYELRYAPGPAAHGSAPARILRPEHVQALQQAGRLRLNVGCGHKPDPDRINVDMRELPGVDIVAPADALPFAAGQVHEIYAAHLLEHFAHEHLRRKLLPHWCALLAPGGELRAVVPDAAAMLHAYAHNEISFDDLRLVLYGGQEYEGDFHHTMFTPESLADLLAEQGLQNVRIIARQRRNGLCYECEVVGSKP